MWSLGHEAVPRFVQPPRVLISLLFGNSILVRTFVLFGAAVLSCRQYERIAKEFV